MQIKKIFVSRQMLFWREKIGGQIENMQGFLKNDKVYDDLKQNLEFSFRSEF